MRLDFVLTAFFLLAASWTMAAGDASGVIRVDHEKVAAALRSGGTLVAAPDLTVMGSHRDKPGQVEVHDKETDVLYIVEGDADFVTGGTVVGLARTRPGQSSGSAISGGEIHHLTKGDVIVIPAGVPHWFKEVHPSVTYYVVKVIKP